MNGRTRQVLIVACRVSFQIGINGIKDMKRNNILKGKVAIITGASSGIGLACAKELAYRGATVVLASRNIYRLSVIEDELTDKGYNALAVKTDVTIESDCQNLIKTTIEEFGKVDYLINNAGLSMRATLSDVDTKVIRQLMEVNFFGTVYCTKYALPHLINAKGSIVGIISVAGYCGLPGRSGYSASKFAMRGFLDTVRAENLHNGLNVLIAAPGFTATNIRKAALTANGVPQGISPRNEEQMMTAKTVAKKIVNGIIHRRKSMTMTNEGKLAVLTEKIFPRLVDRLLFLYMSKEPNSSMNQPNNTQAKSITNNITMQKPELRFIE